MEIQSGSGINYLSPRVVREIEVNTTSVIVCETCNDVVAQLNLEPISAHLAIPEVRLHKDHTMVTLHREPGRKTSTYRSQSGVHFKPDLIM